METKRLIKNLQQKLRRICASLLILGMIVSLTSGCDAEEQADTKNDIKIGIAIYDQYDLFLTELVNEFNEYVQTVHTERDITATVDLVNAANSQSTQNSQVKDMMKDDYDVICVNLVDWTDAGTIIEMSIDYNKPVIFFNRELVDQDLNRSSSLYYVGAVVEDAGQRQGELAAAYYAEHPELDQNGDGMIQYIILEGGQSNKDAISRTNECVKVLENEGVLLDKVGFAMTNWSRDQAKSKIEQLIEADTDIELILSNNDAMALGAIDAYENSGIRKSAWPAIFGIDGIDEGLKAVKDGLMQATVKNDYVTQADAMFDLSLTLAGLQDFDELTWKPDENRCIRATYENVTPCDTCEQGYAVWNKKSDLLKHKREDAERETETAFPEESEN